MKTVSEQIHESFGAIRSHLVSLVCEQPGELRKINTRMGDLVFVTADHVWPELDQDGRRLQARLRQEIAQVEPLIYTLLRDAPKRVSDRLRKSFKTLDELVEQQRTWNSSRAEAFAKGDEAIGEILGPVDDLYDPEGPNSIVIPDTNALLWNPALDDWVLPDVGQFTMQLTPPVLAELDALKVDRRNPAFTRKVESLIRRIKSYRQRGNVL